MVVLLVAPRSTESAEEPKSCVSIFSSLRKPVRKLYRRCNLKRKTMRFKVVRDTLMHHGQLLYIQEDMAFDFFPHQVENCTILIQAINLSFAEYHSHKKCASQVWGYHSPPSLWTKKDLHVPGSVTGCLVLDEDMIEDGDIKQLEEAWSWITFYDARTGWVCLGDERLAKDDVTVEFATDCLAVVSTSVLKAIWLKPIVT